MNQELGLNGAFQNGRCEAEERSHGKDHDRTKTALGSSMYAVRTGAPSLVLIDEVVHNHSAFAKDTHEGYCAQGYW